MTLTTPSVSSVSSNLVIPNFGKKIKCPTLQHSIGFSGSNIAILIRGKSGPKRDRYSLIMHVDATLSTGEPVGWFGGGIPNFVTGHLRGQVFRGVKEYRKKGRKHYVNNYEAANLNTYTTVLNLKNLTAEQVSKWDQEWNDLYESKEKKKYHLTWRNCQQVAAKFLKSANILPQMWRGWPTPNRLCNHAIKHYGQVEVHAGYVGFKVDWSARDDRKNLIEIWGENSSTPIRDMTAEGDADSVGDDERGTFDGGGRKRR